MRCIFIRLVMDQETGLEQDARHPTRNRARRRGRTLVWTALVLALLTVSAAGSAQWLKGREFLAPLWLRERIAERLSGALPDVQVDFGNVVAVIEENWLPRFSVRDLTLRTAAGEEIVAIADVNAALDTGALLDRRLALRSLDASGVFLTLQRTAQGTISLSAVADGAGLQRQAPNLLKLIGELDAYLLRPELAGLVRADVRAITLRYEDLRVGRAWTVDGGRMRMSREGNDVQVALDLALLGGVSGVATVAANYASVIGEQSADFGFTIANLDSRDIASQGPEFAWLRALEAPISGALRGGLAQDGRFKPLNATFQIGAGVIQPTPESRPIPIDGARSYFSYFPDDKLLRFDELSVDSMWGRGRLEGQAVMGIGPAGQLADLVGQFRLSDLAVNPDRLYPEPKLIAAAELDFRLRPAPFVLEIGRFQLSDQGQMLSAQGRISAGQQGWDIALDGELDGLAAPRLVELWPERIKPKTRNWIAKNVRTGQVRDASGALRIVQGGVPRTYLSFDFENADFTFVDNMPPVENARGHASLIKDRFVLVLDEAALRAPEGGVVDASGTSFIVPDTKAKPDPPGVVRLVAEGSVTAALSLLDQPPLKVMQKADLPVALAEGQVALAGTVSMPLKKKTPVEEVSFDMAGTVRDARSTRLIREREVAAPKLALTASETEVSLSGRGTLDGVALDLTWRQQLGRPGDVLPGKVTGRVDITPAALDAFRIDLPPGTLDGATQGDLSLDLLKGTAPRLALQSDLRGMAVRLPPVGWSKPASTQGRLDVEMTLGAAPSVDRLVLEAPGLYAAGSVSLTEEQKLDRLKLDDLRIGGWLNAPVDLVGRGEGRPVGVELRGGTVDLRKADLPAGAASRGDSGPLTVALDRLQISDTIALTDVRGDFSTSGGLSGAFRGRVNGSAPVSGRTTPQGGRSAIRVTAKDAGRVLAAAGVLKDARAGDLDLELVPVGRDGAFDGKLRVTDASIADAPTMAELLNAISVVGLINELNGDGIYFSEVTADFRLAPSRITLREAAAVGASMGLSMDGVFEPDSGRLQMQGVISPVYLLNAIGSVFTRKGEGLFGFNYSISGTTEDPKVFVNPLTALAPGMLRNLFRGDEPTVPLEPGEIAPQPEPRRIPPVTRGEDR